LTRGRRLLVPVVFAAGGLFVADVASVACGPTTTDDPGDDAYMRVVGAQFVRGPMPTGSSSGPSVLSINLVNSNIYPNFPDDPIAATLAPTSTAAFVGMQGDVGYWIVVAGVPGFTTPNDPSMSATAQFSGGIVAGQYTLVVEAVDQQGDVGAPATEILTATGSQPSAPPPVGQLVVTLTWDNDANLDLHVVDPAGNDLYWGDQSTQPPFMFQQVDGGS
jgi:hypothetical protein